MTDASTQTKAVHSQGQQRSSMVKSVLKSPLGALSVLLILAVVLTALFAPLIAPNDPAAIQIFRVNAAPGDGYLLGGDGSGRDIFSRLVYGARNTLLGTLIAVGVAAIVGVSAGLAAGYHGRKLEVGASWLFDALMALPAMIVLLAFYQALGASIHLSMVVFGVMLSPGFFRLTRTLVKGVKNELYVDAARVSGLSDLRIISRHILRVVRAPVVIQTSIVAGIALVIQAGLEFLGLGDPGTPTWGGVLQSAFENMYVSPQAVIWPGLAISITVASFVLLANSIRDQLQHGGPPARLPKLPKRRSVFDRQAEADVLLSLRGVKIGYPGTSGWREVVHGVDLDVRRGEVLGLVGESGSGKSQTAFAVLGLLGTGGHVLDGSILFDGEELLGKSDEEMHGLRGKRIAYVPQEPMSNLDPSFRIGSQLVEPLMTVQGMSRREARAHALDMLRRVGLPDPKRTFNAYPHEVSGGMAQRVLIAGAVATYPDLLIADEPTTALDVTVQAEILELLRELQAEFGMTIVMVTHNFGVVADICDSVAVMRQGEIVEQNEVTDLFANPTHDYTRNLLAAVLDDVEVRRYSPPKFRAQEAAQ